MKKFVKKDLILTSVICLFPILLGIILYNKLPSELPIHFDMNGNPDNYANKNIAIFILPLVLIILNIITFIAIENDPKNANSPKIIKNISKWIIPIIAIFIAPSSYLIPLGIKIDIVLISYLFIYLLFILTGNYLPKCRPNYTIGVKVPWTLNSEENWRKTHRLTGFLFFFVGLIMVGAVFFKFYKILIIALPLLIIVPTIYSFILYKKGI